MNFSVSHIHILQNSPSTPPYADFRACQEARAKLPRGSYEGQGPKQTSEGGPGQGTSKQKPAKLPFHKKGARERARLLLADIHLHIKGSLGRGRDHLQNDQANFQLHTKRVLARNRVDVRPHSREDLGWGHSHFLVGGFGLRSDPPTGSLVAAINLLSKRK